MKDLDQSVKSKHRLRQWVEKRWPLSAVVRWGSVEEIPGGSKFAYVLGSATMVLFVVLVITGIWQLLYYAPTVDHAYDSVMFLRLQVPLGWLVHGLHYWAAQAFIVVMGLHVVRVFIWAAYKKPRELTWLLGVVLLLLGAAFIFTGAILPWDAMGYWAGVVGTSMAGSAPLIGNFLKLLMRGGDTMGQMTLSRAFAVHVAILPALTIFFIVAHLVAFRQFGSVGPWKPKKPEKTGSFWPDQTFKDLLVVALIMVALVCLSAFVRAPISGPADPLDNSYTPKPEWNFLFLYEALKAFKGSWEWIGTVVIPALLVLLLFAVPFIDRNEKRNPFKRPIAMLSGFMFVAVILVLTFVGYYSNSGANAPPPAAAAAAPASTNQVATPAASATNPAAPEVAPPASTTAPATAATALAPTNQVATSAASATSPAASSVSTNAPAAAPAAPPPTNQVAAAAASAPSPATPQAVPPVSTNAPATASAATVPTNQIAASAAPAASPATSGASQTNTTSSTANVQEGSGLFASAGCAACHKIEGKGGVVGPDLSQAAKLGRSSQWLIQQITDPAKHNPSTKMPANKNLTQPQLKSLADFILNPIAGGGGATAPGSGNQRDSQLASGAAEWRTRLVPNDRKNPLPANPTTVKAGDAIYQGNCLACHGSTGKGDGVAAIAMSKRIPDLSAPPVWAYSDGQLFGKITQGQGEMPGFETLLVDTQRWEVVNYIRTLAPKPSGFLTNAPEAAASVSTNAPAAAAATPAPTNQIAASPASAPGPAKPEATTPASTNAPAAAPAARPPTNQVAASAAPAPGPAKPEAATPPSTNALASAPAAPAPNNQVAAAAAPAASPAAPEAGQTNTPTSTANVQEGSGLFASAGCAACHKIEGKGGVTGPDLSQQAKLGRSSQWLIAQITDPAKHNPSTKMPANKNLTQPQLQGLADFILNPSSSPAAPGADTKSNAEKPPSVSAAQPAQEKPNTTNTSQSSAQSPVGAQGAPATIVKSIGDSKHGAVLFDLDCAQCHGKAGEGNVPNVGSQAGVVAPLAPISPGLFSDDPLVFTENIDRVIQHGASPPGSSPALLMPAFGDTHALTLPEIANIEAYILSLNGVDAAKIIHPGITPLHFVEGTVALFVLALLVVGGLWVHYRTSPLAQTGEHPTSEEFQTLKQEVADLKHKQEERSTKKPSEHE